MAIVRSKFTQEQLARRKTESRSARKKTSEMNPLVKMLLIFIGLLFLYALGAVAIYSDLSKFIAEKPLPMPKVPKIGQATFDDLEARLRKGIFQKKKEALTLAELNALSGGPYDEESLVPGTPLPQVDAEVYLTDKDGKLVILVSIPLGKNTPDSKFISAVLLFTPVGPESPKSSGQPSPPRELKLVKAHAGGRPLSDAQVARLSRLTRIIYQQCETVQGDRFVQAQLTGQTPSGPASDPNAKLTIKYADATVYFNGFEP